MLWFSSTLEPVWHYQSGHMIMFQKDCVSKNGYKAGLIQANIQVILFGLCKDKIVHQR